MSGRVYIVGGGCGGAGLLTLRARELIARCGALVYDDLIHPDILALAPREARLVYMGKRAGHSSARQEDICAALVALAREGLSVVRLKGGDPFVFGRGGEELLALREAGIPCAEVPGISSALAVPAEAGIPLTHRALSRGFHVVTAHTAGTADGLPEYFSRLASLPGTLVILMGLARLGRIAERLMESGAAPDTPAAVLSGGNSRCPAAVRGTLGDIAERAAAAQVEAPAVIVVGQAAALQLTASLPLSGVRVGLTGTESFQGRLRPLLEAEGAEVFAAARSETVPLESGFDPAALDGGSWALHTARAAPVRPAPPALPLCRHRPRHRGVSGRPRRLRRPDTALAHHRLPGPGPARARRGRRARIPPALPARRAGAFQRARGAFRRA